MERRAGSPQVSWHPARRNPRLYQPTLTMDTIGAVGRVAAIHFITPSHVLAGLERLHALVVKEQELAEARLRKSGRDDAMAIVVALGAFETPEPTKEF